MPVAQTGNGAIYAATERKVLSIGVDADQYFTIGDQYKGSLVSSAMKLLTPGVFGIIQDVHNGTFKGGNNTGTVGVAPYHDQAAAVSADVQAKIDAATKGILDGSIKTCVSPAKGAPAPAGCPGGAPAGTPTAAAGTGKKLKIGLVTDVGRLNDKSFNQTSWEGVQKAGSDLGDEIKSIETTDTKDYDKNIQQFVSDNYDVIVTVGFNMGEATVRQPKPTPTSSSSVSTSSRLTLQSLTLPVLSSTRTKPAIWLAYWQLPYRRPPTSAQCAAPTTFHPCGDIAKATRTVPSRLTPT